MAKSYTAEFRRDAVRIAMTRGLTRPQRSSDLGVGLSTLTKWVQRHPLPDRVLSALLHKASEVRGSPFP
jgi:transposase